MPEITAFTEKIEGLELEKQLTAVYTSAASSGKEEPDGDGEKNFKDSLKEARSMLNEIRLIVSNTAFNEVPSA